MSALPSRVAESLQELPTRSLAAGETLIGEESSLGAVYFLKSGVLRVVKEDIELARVSQPGAAFGEMSYFLDGPATATVEALEDAEVYVAEEPSTFFMAHPSVLIHVSRTMARRMDGMNRYLVDVKRQFGDQSDHLGMLDEMVNTLMAIQPREIERRDAPEQ